MLIEMKEARKVRADVGATAWLNAAIASGQDDSRRVLYRTLAIEFFRAGIQFVGCDGAMLFRTWAPYSDCGDLPAPHPEMDEAPEDSVVVADVDKFALGFMRTILSALGDDPEDLSIGIDFAERESEPPLGKEVARYALTLRALGQLLSCPLFDGQFPDWRRLEFGLPPEQRVDGMTLSPKMFAAVGKVKGTIGLDCSFRGQERAIRIASIGDGVPSLRGLLMPMRRPKAATPPPVATDDQLEHETDPDEAFADEVAEAIEQRGVPVMDEQEHTQPQTAGD